MAHVCTIGWIWQCCKELLNQRLILWSRRTKVAFLHDIYYILYIYEYTFINYTLHSPPPFPVHVKWDVC